MPGGSPRSPLLVRTTRPITWTGSGLPGMLNWRATVEPTTGGDSVSTNMPPSLMLRAKSEKSSSTVL